MDTPQITQAHDVFKKLVGTWQGEEIHFPSEWNPEGSKGSSRIRNQIALGGFYLIQDLAQSRDGEVVYRAHNLIRWDESEQSYVLHWFDSGGFPPNELRGRNENDALVFIGQDPGGHTRLTFDIKQPKRYKLTMDGSEDGENWRPVLEGVYQRLDQ